MRVLIVEDDVALGAFLMRGLKLEGHEVDLVGDGSAALEHAAAERPDLMVLDLGLPKMDGVEVLRGDAGFIQRHGRDCADGAGDGGGEGEVPEPWGG